MPGNPGCPGRPSSPEIPFSPSNPSSPIDPFMPRSPGGPGNPGDPAGPLKPYNTKMIRDKKIESSLHSRYYTEACNEWRGQWGHFRGYACGQHNYEETSQRWRAISPRIKPMTFRIDGMSLTTTLNKKDKNF